MKLRTRLHLMVTGLTIAWAIVLVASEVQLTRSRVREDILSANQVTIQLLGRLVGIYWRVGGAEALTGFLTQLGHVRSADIVLTYRGGRVLYHSPPATYKAGHYAPAWFADLVSPSIPRYVFPLPSGLELTVRAAPSRGILDGWGAITHLLAIAGIMLVIVNGAALWIVERAVAPVVIEQRLTEERRLIAHELHDEFGQSVTAIRSLAEAIAGQSSQPPMQEAARLISQEAARLYDAMHGLIPRLAPAADDLNLSEALDGLVRDLQRRHPSVLLTLRHELSFNPSPGISLAAYRVVREGLVNALRHSHASRVDVELRAESNNLRVTVTDDGVGLSEEDGSRPGHYGLRGLGERVDHLGGKLTLRNSGPHGALLAAEIPLAGLPQVSA